jgi:ribosomal protein RSM22 (predicted rRNA methylase)
MSHHSLPTSLRQTIENLAQAALKPHDLLSHAEKISASYRRESQEQDLAIKNSDEGWAYVAARLPATYAANHYVFSEILKADESYSPPSMLDMGAGPGTSTLAGVHVFPSIQSVTLSEPNAPLRQIGKVIFGQAIPTLAVDWHDYNLTAIERHKNIQNHAVIVLSYVLNEAGVHQDCLNYLWQHCDDYMIVIEPGTPTGADVIQQVRNWAVNNHIHILAPCPHANKCPMIEQTSQWCHFSVRAERSKLHKYLKGGEAGFEDEKFSYIILSKHNKTQLKNRVLSRVTGQKIKEFQICGQSGLETLKIAKSDGLYKTIKKLEWGDAF